MCRLRLNEQKKRTEGEGKKLNNKKTGAEKDEGIKDRRSKNETSKTRK